MSTIQSLEHANTTETQQRGKLTWTFLIDIIMTSTLYSVKHISCVIKKKKIQILILPYLNLILVPHLV